MNKIFRNYKTLVFDCDGVVLDSNKVKTQAFYEAAKSFGHDSAQKLVDYHVENGGVSRYLKFEYFLKEIICTTVDKNVLTDLLSRFSSAVKKGLLECDVASGLNDLKEQTDHANWLIVSGGDQAELRSVFKARDLHHLFNGGVFGSPDDKETILRRQVNKNNISSDALFLGDSKYDFFAASNAGLDFVFLSDWSEVSDWQAWVDENRIKRYPNIESLLRS